MTIILLFFLLEKKEIYIKPRVSILIPISFHFNPFLTILTKFDPFLSIKALKIRGSNNGGFKYFKNR